MTASRLGLADSWGSIQSIRFNQDSTAFAVSLDSGLRVFNVDPLRELSHYGADKVGSIARAEMLFRTNLLAVVSTSHQSDSPSSSAALVPCHPNLQQCHLTHWSTLSPDPKSEFPPQ